MSKYTYIRPNKLEIVDWDLEQQPEHKFSLFSVRDLINNNLEFAYHLAYLSRNLNQNFWDCVPLQKLKTNNTWILLKTSKSRLTRVLINLENNYSYFAWKGQEVSLERFQKLFNTNYE